MTKQQLIDRITGLNQSAQPQFLAEFSEAELQQYLTNLESVWDDFTAQFVDVEDDAALAEEPAVLLAG